MSTKPTNGSKNDGSRNAKKRKRQTSGLQSSTKKSPVYDLWVPVPKDTPLLHTQEMQQRLASTGFTHMALTHTVFGAPKQSEDKAENAIPDSLFNMSSCRDQKKLRGAVSTDDASSREKNSNQQSPIKVLRRLHAVLENLSDVGHYVKRRNEADAGAGSNKSAKILQEYDLVSLAPRNDATFQSACSSANASDIITLDYTSGRGGVQLPFRIRPADVKAVIARKAVFEIPYAPAILNRNQRKGLVQTCRLLQMASLSGKPKVILSSGSRVDLGMEEDVGVLALRNPSDLENVCQVIMKFDARMAYESLHTAGTYALQQAQIRRFGESSIRIAGIRFVENGATEEELPRNGVKDDSKVSSKRKKANDSSSAAINDNGDDESSAQESGGNAQEDGFIAF